MTFIKSLKTPKREKAQASLEYFVLFSMMAILTILSLSAFFPKLQRVLQGNGSTEGFFQKAIGVEGLNVGNK